MHASPFTRSLNHLFIHSFSCKHTILCNHFSQSEKFEQMKWHVRNMLFTRPILMEQNVMYFTHALTLVEGKESHKQTHEM